YDGGMADRGKARLVFSPGIGGMWAGCGWAPGGCSGSPTAPTESGSTRTLAKLRMEKNGRGGKTVTVVDNLPNNAAFLKELCQDLKRTCGTGGTVTDGAIELQGDLRDR